MKKYEPSLTDRLGTAAKARTNQLKKAREKAPANDPGFAAQQAARRLAADKRKERVAERKAAKLADKVRKTKEKADEEIARAKALKAEEIARAETLKAEEEARLAEAEEQRAREIALEAERKAERDRRYAARQARQR